MEKIHILTDSSSDIPHDLVEAHGIEIVPIMLTHEGRSFREYYDITSEDYCKLLETSSEIPGTAMTTPTVFLESYNRAFERGCTHLLAVLINGGGSGTYQAACLAKSMFEEESPTPSRSSASRRASSGPTTSCWEGGSCAASSQSWAWRARATPWTTSSPALV